MVVRVDVRIEILGRQGQPHLLLSVHRIEPPALYVLCDPLCLLLDVELGLWDDVGIPLLHLATRTPRNAAVLLVHQTTHCLQEDAVDPRRSFDRRFILVIIRGLKLYYYKHYRMRQEKISTPAQICMNKYGDERKRALLASCTLYPCIGREHEAL